MDSNKTIQDEINEYRALFEKSLASIAAYQEKAQIEMAEIRARHDESHANAQIEIAEIRAIQKKTDKQLKKAHKDFYGKWGRLVESLVEGDLAKLLRKRKIDVHSTHPRQQVSYLLDDGTRKHKEFDIVVANGSEVVAVEVKTTLTPEDVTRFIAAMRDFSRYFPYWGSRTVYGAVAYIHCEAKAEVFAERRGLYVIRATGGSASILNRKKFKPTSFTRVASSPPGGHLRAVPAD